VLIKHAERLVLSTCLITKKSCAGITSAEYTAVKARIARTSMVRMMLALGQQRMHMMLRYAGTFKKGLVILETGASGGMKLLMPVPDFG